MQQKSNRKHAFDRKHQQTTKEFFENTHKTDKLLEEPDQEEKERWHKLLVSRIKIGHHFKCRIKAQIGYGGRAHQGSPTQCSTWSPGWVRKPSAEARPQQGKKVPHGGGRPAWGNKLNQGEECVYPERRKQPYEWSHCPSRIRTLEKRLVWVVKAQEEASTQAYVPGEGGRHPCRQAA